MPLAEGKNIHFSPVDNKPLCSYSNKLCRQRRLNGFGFCIRHILEDKSAPFKQCDYVTRNNSQKCLNAIPTNQERGYCHSHMQVAGIIPKTERKVKPPVAAKPIPVGDKTRSESVTNVSDSTGVKLPTPSPNGLKLIKGPPKGRNEKVKLSSSTSDGVPAIMKNSISNNTIQSTSHMLTNGFLSPIPPPPAESTKKKSKSNGKKVNDTQVKPSSIDKPPSKSKKKKVPSQPKGDETCLKWKSSEIQFSSTSTAFEQLKTLKILEKLPIRTSGEHLSPKTTLSIDETTEINVLPQFLRKSISSDSISTVDENESGSHSSSTTSESRQEFLQRVRSSFKSQYKVLRRVVKVNEKSEVKVNEPLRQSLLACVVIDPSRCAHILVNGEDELELDSKGRKGSKPPNGVLNGKRKEKVTPLQGNQDILVFNKTNSTIDKVTKPKKAKSKKKVKNTEPDEKKEIQNHVQLEVGNDFLGPWMNGNVKSLETTKSDSKKGKSKAKANVKTEPNSKTGEKKAPRKSRNGNGSQSTSVIVTDKSLVSTSNIIVPPPAKKYKKEPQIRKTMTHDVHQSQLISGHGPPTHHHQLPLLMDSIFTDCSFMSKKRRIELSESASTIMSTNGHLPAHHHHHVLDPNITLNATAAFHTAYSPSDLSAVAQLENVLNSVSSSDTATTPDGVITDASFDSPFDHSTSSHPDCDFPDDVDELEKSFELHIDAEIAHQASRLIEENGFTEEDFSELFPENRLSDHKLGTDLGIDFTSSNFEPTDIDYAIFSNIFPNYRPPGSNESISVTQNF